MLRLKRCSVALWLAVTVAACDAPDPAGIDTAARSPAASLNGTDVARPLTGTIVGADQYGAPCGDGAGLTIISTGTGTISHLGKTLMASTTCVNLSDFSAIGVAPFALTAANGDELGGFLTGVVYTADGFDLYYSVTWGTGRFAGVSGELVFPTTSTGPGQWSSGVQGTISY